MFKLFLLFLTLSGLQAVPLPIPGRVRKTALIHGFQQGTEPSRRFLVNLDTGLVQEHISEMSRRVASIHRSLQDGETERRHLLTNEVPDDVPAEKNGGGWVRAEEPSASRLPDGFRQGTEPKMSIPDGFRQGTERFMPIPDGFRQGTERFMPIPDGFRQGTERFMPIPDGFRQGTERFMPIPEGFRQGTERFMPIPESFRQGTEPFMPIPDGFRQGTEPFMPIPEGFRQGTEPSIHRLQKQTAACKGEVINGNCYEFDATPLTFQDAQARCNAVAQNAELASITSGDLHSRLVSLVTGGGERKPVLTWLGGTVKNQKASWVDGSEWSYSDWMPGHPNIHTDKPVCVEMFKIDESWWTANDCEETRAHICSYPIDV